MTDRRLTVQRLYEVIAERDRLCAELEQANENIDSLRLMADAEREAREALRKIVAMSSPTYEDAYRVAYDALGLDDPKPAVAGQTVEPQERADQSPPSEHDQLVWLAREVDRLRAELELNDRILAKELRQVEVMKRKWNANAQEMHTVERERDEARKALRQILVELDVSSPGAKWPEVARQIARQALAENKEWAA